MPHGGVVVNGAAAGGDDGVAKIQILEIGLFNSAKTVQADLFD
jgi:hypothetical protein